MDVDGAVYACPIAFEQQMSYGNLGTTSLDDIWNNELYVATRNYLSREGDDRKGLPTLPCYDCRWYGKCEPSTDQAAIHRDDSKGQRSTDGQVARQIGGNCVRYSGMGPCDLLASIIPPRSRKGG